LAPSNERPALTTQHRQLARSDGAVTVRGGKLPAPSGPNSVPTAAAILDQTFHARRLYSSGDHGHRRTSQRSTHEHHTGLDIRSWLWTTFRSPGAP
jgi:hypothetical protein